MNGMIAALSAKPVSAIAFFVCVVFAVGSLELLDRWIKSGPKSERSRLVIVTSASLALVFLAMIAGGLAAYVLAGHATFLSLGLFLTGAAGSGILGGLMFQFHFGHVTDDETRRVIAHDL